MMEVRREWLSRFFCLALLKLCVVLTSGIPTDIYEDFTITFGNGTLEINNTVNVHENATLAIQPGVKIKFSRNGSLNVHGMLVANGTETLPIEFSSSIEPNVNRSEIISDYTIASNSLRLVDGNGYNIGRLEIFHRGIWGTVCGDGWSLINNDVACRELGFSMGTFAWGLSVGTGQIWLSNVRCTIAHRSLKHCRHDGFGTHDCGHWNDVWLRCIGPKPHVQEHQISKSIFHFAGKGKSSMKNVKIHTALQHQYLAEDSSLSKFPDSRAILCYRECPYVSNINITGFALAVEIRNYGNILLGDIHITNCFYGVVATKKEMIGSSRKELSERYEDTDVLRFKNIAVTNTSVGIIVENRFSLPIVLEKISMTNCYYGMVISKTLITRVKMSKLTFNDGVNAITTKTTHGRFERIDLCDGNNNLHNYNRSFPVEIYHYSRGNRNKPCSMVFVTSMEFVLSAFVSEIMNVVLRIHDYNSSELLFQLSRDTLSQQFVMDSNASAINVSIQFQGSWDSNNRLRIFLSSRPKRSEESHMLDISDVTIRQYTGTAISLDVDHYTTTVIRNSNITNTSAKCLTAGLDQGSVLKLINNTFEFNKNTGATAMLEIFFNDFSLIHVKGNILHSNDYKSIFKFYALRKLPGFSRNSLLLLDNRFFNNIGKHLVDIAANVKVLILENTLMRNEVEKGVFNLVNWDQNLLNFTRNILIANAVRRRIPLDFIDVNYAAAVICSASAISVNKNFFENPKIPLEIILTPIDDTYQIDGRYNWWGTSNGSEIILRIFDFRHRNYLPRLNFSPFLASANVSDIFDGQTSNKFRRGNVLGGLVTGNIVLEKNKSPYSVTRDVIIHPNASLTIERGVEVNVLRNLGFLVYGKFELLGDRDNSIKFNLATRSKVISNFGQYPIRLVNGSKPWEGIVEILYNNTWGTICLDGNSYFNGLVLCRQLGFESYIDSYRHMPSFEKPVWWRFLSCDFNIQNDIGSCPFVGWGVSCPNGSWAVRCNPGFWRGIRFREIAKTSAISHVRFERGGGIFHNDYKSSYVLQFDVLRQVIEGLEMLDCFGGSIKIAFQTPGFYMRNIQIRGQERRRYNSYGIETLSTFTCYNCSISEMSRGIYIRAISIQAFADDEDVKRIDSLVVPDTMLRKEYSMCEQNKTIIVGNDDMKFIAIKTASFSRNVECILKLTLSSKSTLLIMTEWPRSSYETFTIAFTSNSGISKNKSTTASNNDAYNVGSGNLTLRYRRTDYSDGEMIRLVIFSQKDGTVYPYRSSQSVFVKNSDISDCGYGVSFGSRTNLKNVEFENCVLRRISSVVGSNNYYQKTAIILHRCILVENDGIYYSYNGEYNHEILVSECSISKTRHYGFLIDSSKSPNIFINNCKFSNNFGPIVLHILQNSVDSFQRLISITNNVFVNNSLRSPTGLIDLNGIGIRTVMIDINKNTFIENKCSFLIRVDAKSNRAHQTFSFRDNILEHNEGVPFRISTYNVPGVDSYSMGLLGCTFNNYDIQSNVFNNVGMDKELFIGRTCGSNYISANNIDATLNYWGTSSAEELRKRIFHFDNWNDRPKVRYLPAAATRNFTSIIITSKPYSNQSQLGGYINTSLLLTRINSPYVVMNDLTISEKATLHIEPGVYLYFKPNIGLLILGNIFARGNKNESIKFCSLENRCKNKQRQIRLFGDNHRGILEVLVGGIWRAACHYNFTFKEGAVACRQLGYGRYVYHSRRYHYIGNYYKVSFNCSGNETSLFNCKNRRISHCGRYYDKILYIECERNFKWGSIKIITHSKSVDSTHQRRNKQSFLRNIFIHDAGNLHNQAASSIQIIERSLSITHINISNSNGIEIIGQKDIMKIEHVYVESSSNYPAISILGNKGSVFISRALLKGGRQHGIFIAPIQNMNFLQNFVGHGFIDLCDPVQKVYVLNDSYIFLKQRDQTSDIFCGTEIVSPDNTTIHFKLSWLYPSYRTVVTVYTGDRSRRIAKISYENIDQYQNRIISIPSNSLLIEANTVTGSRSGFFAEITVIGKTGNFEDKERVNIYVDECDFQEISGAAVQYISNPSVSSAVKIRRSRLRSSIHMFVGSNDTIEISNNVFTSVNRGGIHMSFNDKQGEASIVNNVISSNTNGNEALDIVASGTSSKLLLAGNYLSLNDVAYPHSLVVIKNIHATIEDNVWYQNSAESIIIISSNTTNISSIITKNVFLWNNGHSHTLLIQSNGREVVSKNVLINPSSKFELGTLPNGFNNNIVNASNNWWGNLDPKIIMKKINDKRRAKELPLVIYQPFLRSPTEIFSTGLCPFGWIHLSGRCYYNMRSSHSFNKSQKMCKEMGGEMLTLNENATRSTEVLHKLHKRWTYGTKLNIWINISTQHTTPFRSNGCWMFDGIIKEAKCGSWKPTFCEKNKHIRCKNACYPNGDCQGKTCKCNKGWEGKDCSIYHCKDVGNCRNSGACVGPNHCKCRLGWTGRGCTVSYCLPFRTCRGCLSRRGCGWCDNTRKCLPGTAYRTDIGHCHSWFYHNCISVARNPSCSKSIKVIDCSANLCNLDLPQSNKGSCQQCKDLEKCYNYNNTDNATFPRCYGWNEKKCAKGFVKKDYKDQSRINQTVLMSTVKLINSDELKIYGCSLEENLVIVTKQSKIKLEKGDVISSSQAEGIFHRVQDIKYTDQHVLMSVNEAKLDETISYGDFSQEVPLKKVMVQDLFEDSPGDDLLQDVLTGTSTINETKVHTITTGSGNVYKCLANTYTFDGDEEVTTFFLVIPTASINGNLSVDDVVVGNGSHGFLETVTEIIQEDEAMFVYTELTACHSGFSSIKKYKTLGETTSSCLGGDNLLGLKITEKNFNLTVGDLIVGRKSGPFLGKVISFYVENDNYFMELMPIISVRGGKIREQFNISDTTASRRTLVNLSLTTTAMFRMERDEQIGEYLKLSGIVNFNARVRINLHTNHFRLKSVGMTLFGDMNMIFTTKYDPSGSHSVKLRRKLINNKEVGRFCIRIVGMCVPGVLKLDAAVFASASALVSASLSTSLTSTYSISAGSIWNKGHGVQRIFDKEGSTEQFQRTRIDDASASVLATLTPTFEVHWPSVNFRRLKRLTVTVLRKIYDVKRGATVPSLFVLKLTPPLTASLDAKYCSEKCPDAGKNVEAYFRGGLPRVAGFSILNIGAYKKSWELFKISLYEYVESKCLSTSVKKPCCNDGGKPGRINPVTKKCEEECDCYAHNTSAPKGVKNKNGSCWCENCPDNSLKRKRSGGKPECPCLCKDGTEKQMNTDSSCPVN